MQSTGAATSMETGAPSELPGKRALQRGLSWHDDTFDDDDGPPTLQRTKTVYVEDTLEDSVKVWACTTFVVGPAVGIWYSRWESWRQRLEPELDAMLGTATQFSSAHPIARDEGVDAFQRSRDEWLSAMLGEQESFKAKFGELLASSEVTDPTSIVASVVFTIALLYALMFLPDASIFLSKETRTHGLVRVPLNAVRHIRLSFLVLLAWQLYAVYSALGTMYRIAKAMEDNVKELRALGTEMVRQRGKYPPEQYSLMVETLAGKRWGLRLQVWPGWVSPTKGWVVDVQFFHEFRSNGIVIAVVLAIAAYVLWEHIREERQNQGKSSRSLLDKLMSVREKETRELEDANDKLQLELEKTQSKLTTQRSVPGSSIQWETSPDTIPYSSLEFGTEIGRGGYGVVYQGKWQERTEVAIKCIEMNQSDMKRVELEAAIFLSLKHPNLTSCYGMSESPGGGLLSPKLCIVTEWCSIGSLDSVLHNPVKQVRNKP